MLSERRMTPIRLWRLGSSLAAAAVLLGIYPFVLIMMQILNWLNGADFGQIASPTGSPLFVILESLTWLCLAASWVTNMIWRRRTNR